MKTLSKFTQSGLSDYINTVKRECVRLDLTADFTKQPKELLAAMTNHPQQTLDKYAAKYGVQMNATDEVPNIIYLIIMSRQGHQLSTLLAEMDDSSARLLAKFNADFHAELRQTDSLSRQHSVLFQTPKLSLETGNEEFMAEQNIKK